jgi:hypothetical protein
VAGRDITEGRASRAVAVDVGVLSNASIWQNTDIAYDVAIGGMPFIYAISDQNPYIRQTAPYRKEQFDNQTEPGEQSLTGWWLRSQSSFHDGTGIVFYDPALIPGEGTFQFADSKGVDIWTEGQATLLNDVDETHIITGTISPNRRPWQLARSIQWNGIASVTDKALTSNVATITTAAPHYFSAGMSVTITGVDATFNGTYMITTTPTSTTFTYAKTAGNVASTAVSPAGTAINIDSLDCVLLHDEYDVDKLYPTITANVSNKALTSNVATLTTSTNHGLRAFMIVEVAGVDATFNGEYTITSVPTPTTFTYAKTATDVTSQAATGTASSNLTHFIDYNSGTEDRVYAICDDGTTAYWVTNVTSGGSTKMTVYKKSLDEHAGTTPIKMFDVTGTVITNAVMEFVKERIVACFDNKVYEFAPSATSLPTPVYTHPSVGHVYTSVTASGSAIYVTGFNGIQSTIQKFTLSTSGSMPTLTSAITAAEFPAGELSYCIFYYLGYMMVGTNKGVRVAQVTDDGSLIYGPLLFESTQPVYGFTGRDHYVWCTTGVDGEPGITRINLSTQLQPLVFPYANDLYQPGVTGHQTTAVSLIGTTDRLFFCTAAGSLGYAYMESDGALTPTGYLTTGYIRYNTLEPKNFKRLLGRGDFTYGSMTLETVDADGTEYDVISYDATVPPVEVTTSQPTGSQEYIAYKFIMYRDGTDNTKGPIFKGYQAKATIATPRQRVIRFPVYCFDVETDKYNVLVGYEGRALDRIGQLETIEETGDVVTWQDLTTGESRQCIIEQITFTRMTPPDRGFTGYGGVLTMTIRTV